MEELVRAAAAAPLRGAVAGYAGYRSVGVAPAQHRGLPSPWLTLVLTLDEPLHVAQHPDPAQPGGAFDALLGGLHTRPALLQHDGRQSGVQVDLSPLAARALLGLPAGELGGVDVHAEDALGPRLRELRERLQEAPSWPARFALLDRALSGWLADAAGPPPQVVQAWRVLLSAREPVRVDALARSLGWSSRHLGARFRAETGLTLTDATRVVRFDRARRALEADPGARLADVAVRHGFYDQAHLAREFRQLAGLPPSRWLAAEVASVQAGGPQPGAGSPA